MNVYKKFCPNVFIACCDQKYNQNDVITLTTKYGKENQHIVHNFLGYTGTRENTKYCYSITRVDGFNSQERAKNKIEKINGYMTNAINRSNALIEASNEGKDFLSLGEPIKIGHHSEKRHRALIERNWSRMEKAMFERDKVQVYEDRLKYWEGLTKKINLSMPESIEFFNLQLIDAKIYHAGLKDGSIPRAHSYSLTYANKRVKDLSKKCSLALRLWGDPENKS